MHIICSPSASGFALRTVRPRPLFLVVAAVLFGLALAAPDVSATAPVINGIANVAMPKNTVNYTIYLSVHDVDSGGPANVFLSTSIMTTTNTLLFPVGSIVSLNDSKVARTVILTPATNQSGTATITVTADNGAGTPSVSTSFTVTVTNTNTAAPGITAPVNQMVNKGTLSVSPTFTVTDSQTAEGSLVVTPTWSSTNTNLISSISVSPIAPRTVTVNFANGETGAASVVLTVADNTNALEKLTTSATFLVAVTDPAAQANSFRRAKGLFVMDSATGDTYDPDGSGPIPSYSLRDANTSYLTNTAVDGYMLRAAWSTLENGNGSYDFELIQNALDWIDTLALGKKLSLIITPNDPPYLVGLVAANQTYVEGTLTRVVPWNQTQRTQRNAMVGALAAHVFDVNGASGTVPFRDDPRLEIINPYLAGGDTGIRDPDPTNLRLAMLPGYTRENLLFAVHDELATLTTEFPNKLIQIGFWNISDSVDVPGNDAFYGATLWEWIEEALLLEFNGITRPRIGFFTENLAASRSTPADTVITGLPDITFAAPVYLAQDDAWTAFQSLTAWHGPFNADQLTKTNNSTPSDGINYGFNTYQARYFELYTADLGFAPYQAELQRWHDLIAAFVPTVTAPTGLAAVPASATQINLSWNAVSGNNYYSIQRSINGGAYSTIVTNLTTTTYSDATGLAAGSLGTYQVKAGASAWSAADSALTWVESVGANDGYITGTTTTNSAGATLLVGRAAGTSLYTGILSFDTQNLPDTVTIASVKLRIKVSAVPTTAANLDTGTVDITKPYFSTKVTLQGADANYNTLVEPGVGSIPNGTADEAYEVITLSNLAFAKVNTTGTTQLRLKFPSTTFANTYLTYYTGNSTAANRPQLVVEF
jgi:hypothetical protein